MLTIDLGRGRVVHRADVGGPARHLGLSADGRRLWTALGNRAAVPSGAVARLVAEPESGAARGAERADRSRRRLGRDDQRPPPPPASPGRALEICREESGAQLAPEAVGALVRPDAQQVAPEAAADGVVPPEGPPTGSSRATWTSEGEPPSRPATTTLPSGWKARAWTWSKPPASTVAIRYRPRVSPSRPAPC